MKSQINTAVEYTDEKVIDLIVIGHTAIDHIIFNDREEVLPGGSGPAVATSAAESGTKVGLLTRIGYDFPGSWFEALKRCIDTEGISILDGRTSCIKIEYSDDGNIRNIDVSLNISYKFGAISVPSSYEKAAFMHICPLPVHDQHELVRACSKYSIVSVDFNQVYEPEYIENPHIVREILEYSDIIFPNEFEAKSITGADNIQASAEMLYKMGPSLVIITLGAKGAALYDGDTLRLYPPQNVSGIIDPTGCGDAFIGGFLSAYIKTDDIDVSMKAANIMAAKKIMKKGAWMIDHV